VQFLEAVQNGNLSMNQWEFLLEYLFGWTSSTHKAKEILGDIPSMIPHILNLPVRLGVDQVARSHCAEQLTALRGL